MSFCGEMIFAPSWEISKIHKEDCSAKKNFSLNMKFLCYIIDRRKIEMIALEQ